MKEYLFSFLEYISFFGHILKSRLSGDKYENLLPPHRIAARTFDCTVVMKQ